MCKTRKRKYNLRCSKILGKMVQKILDSSSSFEHEQIDFVKFWKIIPIFAQGKGLKFNS